MGQVYAYLLSSPLWEKRFVESRYYLTLGDFEISFVPGELVSSRPANPTESLATLILRAEEPAPAPGPADLPRVLAELANTLKILQAVLDRGMKK